MKCLENVKLGWSKNCHNRKLKPALRVTRLPPSSEDDTLSYSRISLSLVDYAGRSKEGVQPQEKLCGLR